MLMIKEQHARITLWTALLVLLAMMYFYGNFIVVKIHHLRLMSVPAEKEDRVKICTCQQKETLDKVLNFWGFQHVETCVEAAMDYMAGIKNDVLTVRKHCGKGINLPKIWKIFQKYEAKLQRKHQSDTEENTQKFREAASRCSITSSISQNKCSPLLTTEDVLKEMSTENTPVLVSKQKTAAPTKLYVNTSCKIPNIVHYIWFGNIPFTFLNYLSILSVHKFQQPRAIFLHGDVVPNGMWWDRTVRDVTGLYFMQHQQPRSIYGKEILLAEHAADIARLQILIAYGGIYLDTDYLILKSLQPLMASHELTLSRETPSTVGNGLILAARGAPFLRLWLDTYRNFKSDSWVSNSVEMAQSLSSIWPHLVHVQNYTLLGPSWRELESLFDSDTYDWSQNYAIHVWRRFGDVPESPKEIQTLKSTLGQVMRYVLYDDKNVRKQNRT